MNKRINILLKNEMIVVFDVDGVLAPYEWGNNKHSVTDEEWNSRLKDKEDIYSTIRPIKLFQNFIQKKGADRVYVCSKSGKDEIISKKKFVEDNYGIESDHIYFVHSTEDKILCLNELRDKLSISENQIAIVEDTVKTLDGIANVSDYMTVHVSSFLK